MRRRLWHVAIILRINRRSLIVIVIKSKKDGFRRCGVAHPKDKTTYPDGSFTEDEELALIAEPMLDVSFQNPEQPEQKEVETFDSIKDFSVPEIKSALELRDVKFRQNDTKYVLWQKLIDSL